MATNNAINLKAAGLVSYDGAGVFTALTSPLTVSNGGSGRSSLAAYSVLCAGTTSTGGWQAVSPGSAGDILLSNGASTLPSFQASSGFSTLMSTGVAATLSDSFVYGLAYSSTWSAAGTSQLSNQVIYIPCKCTLTAAYGFIAVTGTLGSTENNIVRFRVNNTTNYTLTSTAKCSAATNTWTNTGLSVNLDPGDYFEISFAAASFATNPTNVSMSVTLIFT